MQTVLLKIYCFVKVQQPTFLTYIEMCVIIISDKLSNFIEIQCQILTSEALKYHKKVIELINLTVNYYVFPIFSCYCAYLFLKSSTP